MIFTFARLYTKLSDLYISISELINYKLGIKLTPTDPDAFLSLVQRGKENYREPPATPKRGKKSDSLR